MPMSCYFKKNWIYITLKNYLYIDISNPKNTLNKLKGVFKSLKCYFKFTIDEYAPYPVLWVSKPAYIQIMCHDVGWKDKYDTPRFEYPSYIWIHIYKLNFTWYWGLPDNIGYIPKKDYLDDYWEQALWYLYYYKTYSQGLLDKPNIEKAKESWPWEGWYTKESTLADWNIKKSTWNDKFLIK